MPTCLIIGYPGSDIYSTWNVDLLSTKACGEISKHKKIIKDISPINKYEERIFGTKKGAGTVGFCPKNDWKLSHPHLKRLESWDGVAGHNHIFFWGVRLADMFSRHF